MADRYVTHDTMVLERTYAAAPARVSAAFADPAAKAIWFSGAEPDEFTASDYRLDFRVGGSEYNSGTSPDGDVYTYEATFLDIVDDVRIVYTNHMLRNDTRMSVSVTSVEFVAAGEGTTLRLTEHGVYLDGEDKPEYRTEGMTAQLDALGKLLAR